MMLNLPYSHGGWKSVTYSDGITDVTLQREWFDQNGQPAYLHVRIHPSGDHRGSVVDVYAAPTEVAVNSDGVRP